MIRFTHRWCDLQSGLLLLIFGVAMSAGAEPIYKCIDQQGNIAFQGQHCPVQQREQPMVIRSLVASPATEQSPEKPNNGKLLRAPHFRRNSSAGVREKTLAPLMSYECRMASGDIFYRHSACPVLPLNTASPRKLNDRARSSAKLRKISSRKVTRVEACRKIHAASASDRRGYLYDEQISTYDRNLGRDPCRNP